MAGRRLRGFAAAVAVVAGVMLVSGCGVRWETDPSAFPSPDTVTAARNSLADAEAAVLEAATRDGLDADAVAPGAALAAQAHLDVLGGVYVAYPDAPSPSPSVSPAPKPPLAETITSARATAEEVAASTDDADLAFLARSIDLEWALRGLWAEREAETQAAADAETAASASPTPSPATEADSPSEADPVWFPLADGSTADGAGFGPDATTGLPQGALSDLAVAEDEARFAYETLAAQEFAQDRDAAVARAVLHAERSDALAALLDTDPRTPLYQLRDVDLLDQDSRRALERSLEIDLAVRYATLLDGAAAADAAWLLNASFDAYARAMRTEGFQASDVPTLPGLEVAGSPSAASTTPSSPSSAAPAPQ